MTGVIFSVTIVALQLAWSTGAQEASQAGALQTLGSSGPGSVALWIMVVGLVLDPAAADSVQQLVARESDCCSFFDIHWDTAQRRLAISAPSDRRPALGVHGSSSR